MVESNVKQPELTEVKVGDQLDELVAGPITRLDLALYCGASGDHNPMHVDVDFARKAGMDDVFAHGMLSVAYISRMLTAWAPQRLLQSLQVRFVSITHVGDTIHCTGEVIDIDDCLIKVQLNAANAEGDVKIQGEAVFSKTNF